MANAEPWSDVGLAARNEEAATGVAWLDTDARSQLRVALSTIGTFHTFDLARQLEKAGVLAGIHTGYPRFKLNADQIPADKIHTFPWLQGPYMAGWIPSRLRREWEQWARVSFDAFVMRTLPECDVFCGLSGSALRTGQTAQHRGARYVCDRGSAHIRFQETILREEHDRWGLEFSGIDPRVIEREEQEYALADAILVPSQFAFQSFVHQGVPKEKLHLAPYGVDLKRFTRVDTPRANGFDVLFVGGLSLQKGAPYLFAAFERLQHPNKTLTFAGVITPGISPLLKRFASRNSNIRILGHVPQQELKAVMSRSHALILPSVQEGFGLVQAQAMACGCPVVASRNTGAQDLFDDGVEGFIVPPRDTDELLAAMQTLADDPALRDRFAHAALQRVARLNGWDRYGKTVLGIFREIANAVPRNAVTNP